MTILLVSATPYEIAPLLDQWRQAGKEKEPHVFHWPALTVEVLITGVGLPLAACTLGFRLGQHQYDWLLQAGVAGALDRQLELGQVVEVVSECFADLGVEEADGRFTSVMDMGLVDGNTPPFYQGRMWNQPEVVRAFLPQVHGISVNKVHGEDASIAQLRQQYPYAQVESMEGAAFFLAAATSQTPFLQIRAISNYVERRQRENWQLPKAITTINTTLSELLAALGAV